MTIDDLRALALWHHNQAADSDQEPAAAAWHADQATKLNELAESFALFGSELGTLLTTST